MEIIFSEEYQPGQTIIEKMKEAGIKTISFIAKELDSEKVSVSVTFVSGEEIRELNYLYRQVDSVTDVLSFPQYSGLEEINIEGPISLGDIVICTKQALLQAHDYGHTPARELVYLFVHGMLHLLGFNHMNPEEKNIMRKHEETIMESIGLGEGSYE